MPFLRPNERERYLLLTDAELVAACLKGQAVAWDALIDRYAALVYSIGLRMGLSQADAEDVFQDVCVILLDHLSDLRDAAKLSSWLIATTKREVWRLQGRRRPQLATELGNAEWAMESAEGAFAPRPDSPEKDVIELEEQQTMREALTRLPERCRRLMALLYEKETPPDYREIAALFAVPVGSVGPTRARCLQNLRKILAELGY